MSDRFLNAIIIFSIIGILITAVYKEFFVEKKRTDAELAQQRLDLSPTPLARAPISCGHDFFDFQLGTTWEYSISDQSEMMVNEQQVATPSPNIILTLVKNEDSSVVLLATDSAGLSKEAVVKCTTEGLVGLPLQPINDAPVIGTVLFNDYLFLPNNIETGEQWSNSVLGIKLMSTITEISTTPVKGVAKKVAAITTQLDVPDLPNSQVTVLADIGYEVFEGIGITKMNVDISFGEMLRINKLYILEKFTPGGTN